MILVAGATGYVGGEVCRLLAAEGHSVRGIVRPTSDAGRVAALRSAGVQTVEADLRDPASLRQACGGVTAVISTATSTAHPEPGNDVPTVDGAGQVALIDAARAAGAGRFILISFSHGLELESPLHTAKRGAERHLAASGMAWTALCPGAFMEVWLSPLLGFDVPNGNLTIYGTGTAPVSYVSLFDVARFCVASLEAPAARNAAIEIGGPDALAPLDAARIAEEVTGRPMALQHVPEAALRGQYEGATDPRDRSFAALMLDLAGGNAIDMSETAERFGIELTSVRQFMARTYGSGQPVEAPPATT